MAALDMPSGTVVEVDAAADSPDVIFTWSDQFGTPRRTAVDPAFFGEHFTEVGA